MTRKEIHQANDTSRNFVNRHGGGFCICNSITHRRICVELTLRAKVVVIFVSYSLAPEAKFPLAIQECLEAIQWTIANATSLQIDPAKLVVCGDSSGGNFAAAVSCKYTYELYFLSLRYDLSSLTRSLMRTVLAKEHNINLAGQVLWYPGLDPDMNDQAAQQFAEGYGLTRKTMEAVWNMYYANPEDRYNKLVAPLRASLEELSGLPPALVVSCEADLSRESCETYARKLLQAGVDVTATRVLGVIHGPLTIPNWSSSAELVLDMTVAWLKRLLKH